MIYDCNTHSCLWYFNFIAIPSFVCPKLACIEWLISLNNDRHLFADSFVTVRQIAMKFGWDNENVSCLKLRKFCLNPTNFKRKWTMMSKLDLKKITLTEFRTPVQNGLMQTVNIFCTENEHLHAFNAPTKNRTNRMRASCWFLFLKKIGHYFWRRVYFWGGVAQSISPFFIFPMFTPLSTDWLPIEYHFRIPQATSVKYENHSKDTHSCKVNKPSAGKLTIGALITSTNGRFASTADHQGLLH